MRIFVYEYTCATPTGPALPASLRTEGLAMLAAVLADFERIDGVQTSTLLADDFPQALSQCCRRTGSDERAAFVALAREADFTLVIAPEFEDLLETRCRWVAEAGGRSLNASLEAIRLTGDKWELYRHLHALAVPTPVTELFRPSRERERPEEELQSLTLPARQSFAELKYPAVLKPRFGAGSQATFLVRDAAEWQRCIGAAEAEWLIDGPGVGRTFLSAPSHGRQESPPHPGECPPHPGECLPHPGECLAHTGEFIVQQFVPGQAVSVAFLIGPGGCESLWPAAQHLSTDGRFRYLGGTVPVPESLWHRARNIAGRAVAAVPGLGGFVGVDLVLREAEDGSGDSVIEINPRLTTSYIGLRQITPVNLAAVLLELANESAARAKETEPEALAKSDFSSLTLQARMGSNRIVRFYPDGRWERV